MTFTATDDGTPPERLRGGDDHGGRSERRAGAGGDREQERGRRGAAAFTVTAGDPNDVPANGVTLSATGLPAGATFDAGHGVFAWTPSEAQAGPVHRDVHGHGRRRRRLSDSEAVTITVGEVNEAPVLEAIGNKSGGRIGVAAFTVTARDPNDCRPTADAVSATGLPAGATFTRRRGCSPGRRARPRAGQLRRDVHGQRRDGRRLGGGDDHGERSERGAGAGRRSGTSGGRIGDADVHGDGHGPGPAGEHADVQRHAACRPGPASTRRRGSSAGRRARPRVRAATT